jgi:hypothetical protein
MRHRILTCSHCWVPSALPDYHKPKQASSSAALCGTDGEMHNIKGKLSCVSHADTNRPAVATEQGSSQYDDTLLDPGQAAAVRPQTLFSQVRVAV